jgi:hypothetical protein
MFKKSQEEKEKRKTKEKKSRGIIGAIEACRYNVHNEVAKKLCLQEMGSEGL